MYNIFSILVILNPVIFCCSEDEETDEGNPQGENKYIVYESCLLECFKVCVTCLAPCKPSLSLSGSCLTVLTECCNGDRHSWSSRPYVGRKPAGNIDLCAGILFSGSSPAPALRMMRLMNLRVISERTFHEYQEAYLLPAVQTVSAHLFSFSRNVVS